MKGMKTKIDYLQAEQSRRQSLRSTKRRGSIIMALYNNGMQADVAFGHAADAGRYDAVHTLS